MYVIVTGSDCVWCIGLLSQQKCYLAAGGPSETKPVPNMYLFIKIKKLLNFMCMSVLPLCIMLCVWMFYILYFHIRYQWRRWNHGTVVRVVVNHQVGAGSWTLCLWNSNRVSNFWVISSSPMFLFFFLRQGLLKCPRLTSDLLCP